MNKYLVTKGSSKKLLVVQQKDQFESKCREVFDIGNNEAIILEQYLEEFKEYAEVSTEDLPSSAKLRLKLRPKVASQQRTITRSVNI